MSNNWITLSVSDLDNTKVAPFMTALGTAALGDGQADPRAEAIATIVTRIRANIGSCRENVLDADPTKIPASLKDMACRMIVWNLSSRPNVGNALPPSGQDEIDHRDDLSTLRDIAACKLVIEKPDDAETTPTLQATSNRPQITPPRRRYSPWRQEGL